MLGSKASAVLSFFFSVGFGCNISLYKEIWTKDSMAKRCRMTLHIGIFYQDTFGFYMYTHLYIYIY